MKLTIEREVLTVNRQDGVWSVEYEGRHFGHSHDKEITKAAANRHAREMIEAGQACQIRVAGEHGF